MAIFTAIASFILTGTFVATGFGVSLLAAGIGLATITAASYIQKSLAGNPNQDDKPAGVQGVQGKLVAAGDVPRSFQLGYSMTAGSLVYANTWGLPGGTPNAYFTQVIALSDMPCGTLQEVWVNGELCSPSGSDGGIGVPYNSPDGKYQISGVDHLFVRYYDGTQTAADGFLVASVSSAQRPYQSTRVGKGVAYVIVTCLVDDTLFTGFPGLKFAVSGMPLYDPTKDSTNGGSGSHRWNDSTTWGGDGDSLPAVQLYNILRGVYYSGVWLYGLQLMTAARLPTVNWNSQIDKCRATITGVSGPEATYRSGGQVNVNIPPIDTAEHLLTACQGRLSEIGGFYKVHLGSPDSSTFSFTDADILSTEEQEFSPFFGLSDSINGIIARYPSPAEGWAIKTAPALLNSTYEAQDGSRRLLASPQLDFVPYDAQVQRLQKSGLLEARRARRHSLSMGPPWWIVEPGDFGDWTSVRNGYSSKQFRVDGVVDHSQADVTWNITEVDPTDYSWTHATDYRGVTIGPTVFPKPAAQGVVDWFAEPYVLISAGQPRRAAIRLTWDGTLPGIVGVQYEVKLVEDGTIVARGRTDQYAAGALIISQNLIPGTDYEVRGQYIPSSPRDMLWSSWIAVTTPAVDITIQDFDAALIYQVTQVQDYLYDQLQAATQLIAAVGSNTSGIVWNVQKELRSQVSSVFESATASIEEIRTTQVSDQLAFAEFKQVVTASIGDATSSVTTVASAIARLDGYAAASYGVTLDVNGFATGFQLVNAGAGVSSTTFITDKFQIAAPGYPGGDPVYIFTVANVNGSPKVAIRADEVLVDGSIVARNIRAGTITTIELAAKTIVANNIAADAITSDSGVIAALSVKSLSIGDQAITVPAVQTLNSSVASSVLVTVNSVDLSIDTTGLSGKPITILATHVGLVGYAGTGAAWFTRLYIDGNQVGISSTSNSNDWTSVCSGSWTITGNGGVMTVNVRADWNVTTGATGTPAMLDRTLWATAAKR